MPIYAYKCGSCGHAKDVLQKISDAPLTDCPACGSSTFSKQLTAAGFQLKGSSWYATDFKGGVTASPPSSATPGADSPATDSSSTTTAATATADSPAAGGCGASCACH